ncbi:hypothetical protein QL285_061172 [Trifolium repens]|nr:hypothetical protein QL285_061172 [Trifolium repens]
MFQVFAHVKGNLVWEICLKKEENPMEYHKCDWAHCVASPLLVVFLVQNALLLANPPPRTLFLPPRNSGFALEQKLRNAFSKIFLVQI